MEILGNAYAMEDEWNAWQRVGEAMKHAACALDINEEHELVAAIEMWGELLVALRIPQTPDLRAHALAEKVTTYNSVVTD